MNLTEWAKAQGVHPHTAYRWFREGILPVPATRVGPRTILVNVEAAGGGPESATAVGLYARVSSHRPVDGQQVPGHRAHFSPEPLRRACPGPRNRCTSCGQSSTVASRPAQYRAASSSGTSTTAKPPRCSLVSTYGPSVKTGLPSTRSEEHTSELQSHSDLVCRLLLE